MPKGVRVQVPPRAPNLITLGVSMNVSFDPAEAALKNLREGLLITHPSDLERDGVIQRFEYCYEILWKLAQRILTMNEFQAETPREVFRQLGKLNWIDNVEDWINFQKSRNETSHEYGKKLAEKSYQLAKTFLPLAEDLLSKLKDKK